MLYRFAVLTLLTSFIDPRGSVSSRLSGAKSFQYETIKEQFRSSFSPSTHLLLTTPGDHGTARNYEHKNQRQRLWRLTIGEFLLTIILCVVYFGILYAYSKSLLITVAQRRIFNALTTGVSLLLGVNLAASLRSYAKLIRWRMLAQAYRPLGTFDLIMGCDSLMNVIKLLWKSRSRRSRFLPSQTQVFCLLWLLINLAITVLVGMIGLTYNLDVNSNYDMLQKGDVSVVDLNALLNANFVGDLGYIQTWGAKGFSPTDSLDHDDLLQSGAFGSDGNGYSVYFFRDTNPNDPTLSVVTTRYVSNMAACDGFKVLSGEFGNQSYIIYDDGNGNHVNQSIKAQAGPGGLVVISDTNSTCGARCTNLKAFQAQTTSLDDVDQDDGVYQARFFKCNNTMSTVQYIDSDYTPDDAYQFSDIIARMLAGSLGWSGDAVTGDTQQYMAYPNTTGLQFYTEPDEIDMAQWISAFSMGGIAIMDSGVPYLIRKIVPGGYQPVEAQILKVVWRYAGSLLGVIPFIHFWTMMAVIIWANKAIIKDDSHLAIAKVYHKIIDQLGDQGCMLRGEEIVDELGNPKVAYGWTMRPTGYGHTDVFLEDEGIRVERSFKPGPYDGSGPKRRIQYRDFDATEYF